MGRRMKGSQPSNMKFIPNITYRINRPVNSVLALVFLFLSYFPKGASNAIEVVGWGYTPPTSDPKEKKKGGKRQFIVFKVHITTCSADWFVCIGSDKSFFNASNSSSCCFLRKLCAVAVIILKRKLISMSQTTVFQIEANERSHFFTWAWIRRITNYQ